MIGHQWVTQKMRIAGYIGIDHQDHHLSPFDPTNSVVGGETGLKIAGDITMGYGQPWYLNLTVFLFDRVRHLLVTSENRSKVSTNSPVPRSAA